MAADAVMQFAIHRLGYRLEDIVVMGWSIGGYTATWLAMNYPDIKGLVGRQPTYIVITPKRGKALSCSLILEPFAVLFWLWALRVQGGLRRRGGIL